MRAITVPTAVDPGHERRDQFPFLWRQGRWPSHKTLRIRTQMVQQIREHGAYVHQSRVCRKRTQKWHDQRSRYARAVVVLSGSSCVPDFFKLGTRIADHLRDRTEAVEVRFDVLHLGFGR